MEPSSALSSGDLGARAQVRITVDISLYHSLFLREMLVVMVLRYRTGEEIRKGDHVRFHGNPAEVELVSFDPNDPDPEVAWHMKEFGGGVLILDPMVSGRTFIHAESIPECEDLEFVSRSG